MRTQVLLAVAGSTGVEVGDLDVVDGRVVSVSGGVEVDVPLDELSASRIFEATERFQHRTTYPLDADGQGDAHVSVACAAHRAVVDVDPDLGLVRVVQVATAQDVGRALNPAAVLGQVEGGIAQGVGLATMEEILLRRRQAPEPVVHRLPDPHRARHARGRGRLHRAARARRAVRCEGRGRATGDLVHARRRGRHPRRDGRARSTRVPVRPSDITGTG